MVPVIGVSCASYAKHPHLLQLCVPHASAGGLELPATVYLVDTIEPASARDAVAAIKAALESPVPLKITHGAKLWMGLVRREFGIRLHNYFDTQQAHNVLIQLRGEVGKASQQQLANSGDVSLSALLRAHGLHHPVRHDSETDGAKRVWQQRPMTDDLVTCAAADVAYLIPLAELLAPMLTAAAGDARAHWQRAGAKAALIRVTDLPAPLVADLAAGAQNPDGGVNLPRLARWGAAEQLQQRPPPHLL
ncbi:MAG: ribonuclease H-like domain-containing protein [Monoraphidium minutum]|nr:MAG: ribonuclease H-like domain-containing protein [Monoraphidium minutum]